jgi:hypothetical protein
VVSGLAAHGGRRGHRRVFGRLGYLLVNPDGLH